jgi:hypothetical protein
MIRDSRAAVGRGILWVFPPAYDKHGVARTKGVRDEGSSEGIIGPIPIRDETILISARFEIQINLPLAAAYSEALHWSGGGLPAIK